MPPSLNDSVGILGYRRSNSSADLHEVFRGAGDIYNSISMPIYCDGPYIYLGRYITKVLSAWTEVWSGSYRSRARYWLPGVDLHRFRDFLDYKRGW